MSEDRHASHEQVFLLFYGAIIGFLAGIWGNLWATLYFEYVIKRDAHFEANLCFYFWAVTIISIVLGAILIVSMAHYFNRMRRQ